MSNNPKFKVGDKVKVISDEYDILENDPNRIFTIKRLQKNEPPESNDYFLIPTKYPEDVLDEYLFFEEELQLCNSELIKKRLKLK
jgi:hypothetical protein